MKFGGLPYEMHRLGGRNEVNINNIKLNKFYHLNPGWPRKCCRHEDFQRLALSSLQLHQPQPEGEPQGSHPQQTRQPGGVIRLHVLWETLVQPELPSGPHITGPQRGTKGRQLQARTV